MKTLVNEVFAEYGIKLEDKNGNPRPENEVSKDVLALLERCDEETASEILLKLALAGPVEEAGNRTEGRFWRV